ncbi:MAG: hypothetical protein FJ261_01440 [Planctomycetes bacterium]|nr:hypothetical protein [Planctomycetota bacterium]
MKSATFAILLSVGIGLAWSFMVMAAPSTGHAGRGYKSPLDIATIPNSTRAIVANRDSGGVSIIDHASGKVIIELPTGAKPFAVACAKDGTRAAVSNLWDGTVSIIDLAAPRVAFTTAVGSQPRGLAFSATGKELFVALGGENAIARLNAADGGVSARWPCEGEPRTLVVIPKSGVVAVGSTRSARVRGFDPATGKQLWQRSLHDSFNLLGLAAHPSGDEVVSTFVFHRHHAIARNNIEQGWALDNRVARIRPEPGDDLTYDQISLDSRGQAVADPTGIAFSADGAHMAITSAGAQELLLVPAAKVPWSNGDPGDFVDSALEFPVRLLRRIDLGGRPQGLAFAGGKVLVANAITDRVQVIDVASGQVEKAIDLGDGKPADLARRGEALFFDGKRSHHHWFSCHTCHTDGHTSGQLFDTLGDDSYGNPKITPSLRNVTNTGPWSWHGWKDKLEVSIEDSFVETLFGEKPTAEEVKAVVAYLGTLEHPPATRATREDAAGIAKGRSLFEAKAGCSRCHAGPHYTTPKTYTLEIEHDGSPFEKWNPPSLRGVRDRSPLMHAAQAPDLDTLLRLHHKPEDLGGKALDPLERANLIQFLKSLD